MSPLPGLDPISAAAFDELLQQSASAAAAHRRHDHPRSGHDLPQLQSCRRDRRHGAWKRIHSHASSTIRTRGSRPTSTASARARGSDEMEREARYAAVGAFVLLVLAMAVLFVYWYTEGHEHRDYTRYEVYFDGSVSGLARGAPVRYLGVDVGRVVRMQHRSAQFEPRGGDRRHRLERAGVAADARGAVAAGRDGSAVHRSASSTAAAGSCPRRCRASTTRSSARRARTSMCSSRACRGW